MNKGVSYVNKGEHLKAINIFSHFINNTRRPYRSYAIRGFVYLKEKKINKAMSDLSRSLEIQLDPLTNMPYIGIMYCKLNEYELAAKYFFKAVEYKPKSSVTNCNLGWYYCVVKEYEKAIESLNKAMDGNKIYRQKIIDTIYINFSTAYIGLADYDKAIEYISKAIVIKPKRGAAYRNYAYLLRKKGDFLLAKEYAIKAIKLDSYDEVPYKTLAEISLMKEDYEEFYKNFKLFSEKKVLDIDERDIEDSIYDKVRYDERFKELIKDKEVTFTWKELNIAPQDSVLSDKTRKKQKSRTIIGLVSLIVLLIILIYSITKVF